MGRSSLCCIRYNGTHKKSAGLGLAYNIGIVYDNYVSCVLTYISSV